MAATTQSGIRTERACEASVAIYPADAVLKALA